MTATAAGPFVGGSLLTTLRGAASLDVADIGHKAWMLARLAVAGFPVLEGLVLTTHALEAVRTTAGLGPEASAAEVQDAALPEDVALAIEEAAAHYPDSPLAVRSSGVEEDLADESYAGQYTSVLRVRGREDMRRAVRACWASAAAARARSHGGDSAAPRMAVLIQPMVEADVAGVAFTADPVSGDRDVVVVSAVTGTAEHLTDGSVTPDEWRVQGQTATPTHAARQALTEQQALAVATLARRIETELGQPQDVEWVMAGHRLLILQARPITALPQPPIVEPPPGTWAKDIERNPEPLTAFGASVISPRVEAGLTAMSGEWGGLMARFEMLSVGGELYMKVTPIGADRHPGPPPPWWLLGALARISPPLRARARTARRMLRPQVLRGAHESWEHVHRPRLRDEHARLAGVDLSALDDAALDAHWQRVLDLFDRSMRMHFSVVPLFILPVHELIVLCRDELGWSEERSLLLLAGSSRATLEPHRELHRIAAEMPPEGTPTDQLAQWCERYGARTVNNDPGSPTLAERPDLVAALLAEAATDHTPTTGLLREEATAQARQLVASRPARVRRRFEEVLGRALLAYPVREDSAFWTASMPSGLARRAMVETGRRLSERAVLRQPEDAMHLDVDSLRSLLRDPPITDAARDAVRARVARARGEREWVRRHPGPLVLGPDAERVPDLRGLPPAARRFNEGILWALGANKGASAQPAATGPGSAPAPGRGGGAVDALAGAAGSPGRHQGRVRIVRGEADFASVEPGDVVVCRTTDPAWSVLFGVAGALVTDHGGVLCHAAIVAREFGIPAVLGTTHATEVLRDGQQVIVDGAAGRVLLGTGP